MPTLEKCVATYLSIPRAPLTNQQYRYVLSRMAGVAGAKRDIARIQLDDLTAYTAQLIEEGKKPSTVYGYISILKAFFNWCVAEDLIARSPARNLKRPRPERDDDSHAIPAEELERMIEYARLTHPRNYALLCFLRSTGCRTAGLISLRLSKLSLETHSARLVEKGGKNHTVWYGPRTADALRAWLKKRPKAAAHDYVWTGKAPTYPPLSADAVGWVVRRLAEKTGASEVWGPHSIRHAMGHGWSNDRIPVSLIQKKFGHSSASITLDYYSPQDSDTVARLSYERDAYAEDKPLRLVRRAR